MLRKLLYVFIIAFVLNFVWEHFHSVLYVHYQGNEMTNAILTRAALFDGTFIAFLYYFFASNKFLNHRWWLMALVAIAFAIGLETWALEAGRWAYNDMMPIIPYLNTGLTPTIQLGITSYISVVVAKKLRGGHF